MVIKNVSLCSGLSGSSAFFFNHSFIIFLASRSVDKEGLPSYFDPGQPGPTKARRQAVPHSRGQAARWTGSAIDRVRRRSLKASRGQGSRWGHTLSSLF